MRILNVTESYAPFYEFGGPPAKVEALSHGLAQGGHAPERLETSAVCSFEQVEGGFAVTRMELSVRGRVPGLDEDGFREAAEQARDGCPVSKALAGNVELSLSSTLDS